MTCNCGHDRRQHSRDGCVELDCPCTVTYMELSPRAGHPQGGRK